MASPWLAYNDLAWTDELLADPADCENEVELLIDLIREQGHVASGTLLHLGCGAGGYDRAFKRHFAVTGVDISPGMLELARRRHPEIEYIEGDMRHVSLGREFDVVTIPDCIDYMTTLDDLRNALVTAVTHLKPGGLLVVVGKPREIFRENNFAFTGCRDDVWVTLFENNYIPPERPDTYEATLIYLIRRDGALTIQSDRHVLGLFPQREWERLFAECGLTLEDRNLEGVYDPFLLGDGEYTQKIFIGRKRC